MRNTDCIFNWSDNPEPCKNKTKYKGDMVSLMKEVAEQCQ